MSYFNKYRPRLVPRKLIPMLLTSFIAAVMTNTVAAQQATTTSTSTSLMLQFFGPEALGIHVNHNTNDRFSMNIGLGLGLDAHIGVNVYPSRQNSRPISWYGGLQLFIVSQVSIGSIALFGTGSSGSSKKDSQIGAYIPIGLEYVAKKNFTIQVDIGPNFVKEDWDQTNTGTFMGSLKIGYTFR